MLPKERTSDKFQVMLNSRRKFLKNSLLASLAIPFGNAWANTATSTELEVILVGRAADLGDEIVSFGVPLPFGFLNDPRQVKVLDENGKELLASARPLEPWRRNGRNGSIRSLLVQFRLDFSHRTKRRVNLRFHESRSNQPQAFVDVSKTLIDDVGMSGPRVAALLPAGWLCESEIVGPQTPAVSSGEYADYDRLVEKNFDGSLKYLDSQVYHEWLFDRTSCYYKMYVRSGELKFLEAAYHSANFLRQHTKLTSPDAGIFTLKGADLKYVYPRAMHIHYLLTGDDRFLATGKLMAQYCLEHQSPVYRPDLLKPVELGVDPERGRNFWTLRHQGYGLLGILHGWEMTGDQVYWQKARECVDAYYKHQRQPPDGKPPDGSLRQDWKLYDPNEASFKGATSAWMMALLLDPLFYYWTMSSDNRIPEIVVKWCDFLDRQGILPDGSKAYYVINCFAASESDHKPGEVGPDMEMHNVEMAYTFALGAFFTKDKVRQSIYEKRFEKFFKLGVQLDVNHPARAFNWAFQFTSQLVYFKQHPGLGVGLHGAVTAATTGVSTSDL